jgi:hypothetical protein
LLVALSVTNVDPRDLREIIRTPETKAKDYLPIFYYDICAVELMGVDGIFDVIFAIEVIE